MPLGEKSENLKLRQLRLENEILRLEIREKLGKHLPETHDLPLEEENLYLKSLKSVDRGTEEQRFITLYEYIGRPDYYLPSEIENAQIPSELERLKALLAKSRIIVEGSFKVSLREMYYFITEDLFPMEIPAEELKDFYSHFNYEDFYPDDNEEIKAIVEEFLDRLFIGELKLDDTFLAETVTVGENRQLNREEIMEILLVKKAIVSDFELKKFNLESMHIRNNAADVKYDMKFVVNFQKSDESTVKKEYAGDCTFCLEKNELNYWSINQLSIPGLWF